MSVSHINRYLPSVRFRAFNCSAEFALLHVIVLLNAASRGSLTVVNNKCLNTLKCNVYMFSHYLLCVSPAFIPMPFK
jgi:hypothetical protein